MSVFFTDSNCELMNDNGKQSGIEYINMPYISNSIRSLHACTTTSDLKNFYNNNDLQNIEDDVLTKIEYMNIFRPYLQQGNDIIYVTFSNSFSDTFNNLEVAISELRKEFPNRSIKYVDTKNISLGAGVIVYYAFLKYKNGATDDEIIDFVRSFRDEIVELMVVEDDKLTNKNAKKIAKSATRGVLSVKSIVSVNLEGKFDVINKINGKRKALNSLIEIMKQRGQNVGDFPIGIMHCNSEKDAKYLIDRLYTEYGTDIQVWVHTIGPTVYPYCGNEAVGLCFHGKK